VIEVGAGNGLNFRHYPAEVTEVVAVEPEPYLRAKAEEAARNAPVSVRVEPGLADALPFPDGEFDAAVCSLVLCSVPDLPRALGEVRRVLRPGGELRFYEHVRGEGRRARFQDAVDPVWSRIGAGCHANRDTVSVIEQAGFELERVRRFDFVGMLVKPHVIGAARRP
jgi:ubiquinone/menaquinone biosynthesis C-methylase UbiE